MLGNIGDVVVRLRGRSAEVDTGRDVEELMQGFAPSAAPPVVCGGVRGRTEMQVNPSSGWGDQGPGVGGGTKIVGV